MRLTKELAEQTKTSGKEGIPKEKQNKIITCSPRSRLPKISVVEELSTSALLPEDQVPQGTIRGM
jgi:hypothetical protein